VVGGADDDHRRHHRVQEAQRPQAPPAEQGERQHRGPRRPRQVQGRHGRVLVGRYGATVRGAEAGVGHRVGVHLVREQPWRGDREQEEDRHAHGVDEDERVAHRPVPVRAADIAPHEHREGDPDVGELVPVDGGELQRGVPGQPVVGRVLPVEVQPPLGGEYPVAVVHSSPRAHGAPGADPVVHLHQREDDDQLADRVGPDPAGPPAAPAAPAARLLLARRRRPGRREYRLGRPGSGRREGRRRDVGGSCLCSHAATPSSAGCDAIASS
jgi:hypothetical protein